MLFPAIHQHNFFKNFKSHGVDTSFKDDGLYLTIEFKNAFCAVRPPGHHASTSMGMGFCVYNSVAVVARYLQKKYGLERILIVDFDVHHGNGTQDIFYEDNSVFYFSVHQHPLFPGTGRPNEIGKGEGEGYTLNVELPKGSGNNEVIEAFNLQLRPAMDQFRPEFILMYKYPLFALPVKSIVPSELLANPLQYSSE